MDKRILETYSVWAKENLETQIEVSLKTLGIKSEKDICKAKVVGDVTVIEGDATTYPASLYENRKAIIDLIKADGYQAVITEFAYTWFNRLIALRFLEVHNYLSHGFRVLSSLDGGIEPEILRNLSLASYDLSLDMNLCNTLKEQDKVEELFRYVLMQQCRTLAGVLPMLFAKDNDYLELLLPKALLKGDTVLTRLLTIPEEAFQEDVEIIGWMYQFYMSAKKKAVDKSKDPITKDTLPAVTQLFTPDWIVRYMAENSVGRIWMESYPASSLRNEMKYYVDDAEQTEEVQQKLDEIRYHNVNPEDIRIIEPCCGSGHILVYVFDLLYKMYDEKGYSRREIPSLILTKNLVGLDVDKRAAQLASFALIMRARSRNTRFFNENYYVLPKVYEIRDSHYLTEINYRSAIDNLAVLTDAEKAVVNELVDLFKDAKVIGSLLKVKPMNYELLDGAIKKLGSAVSNIFTMDFVDHGVPLLRRLSMQAKVLSAKFDVLITNPPYHEITGMDNSVISYALNNYPDSKYDLYSMFMETSFAKANGFIAMINMHTWMFLSSYERLRVKLLDSKTIVNMVHLGPHAFESISGEIVQTTSFVLRNNYIKSFKTTFVRDIEANSQNDKESFFMAKNGRYIADETNLKFIKGWPFSYWASEKAKAAYASSNLDSIAQPRHGLATSDNARFLRLWYEVDINKTSTIERCDYSKKWFPMSKGGSFRKWYGNLEWLINYEDQGKEIKDYAISIYKCSSRTIQNTQYYFKEGITWSALASGGFSVRWQEEGALFGSGGYSAFSSKKIQSYILALLNSKATGAFIQFISPTLNYEVGHIKTIPVVFDETQHEYINSLVTQNIALSKSDWDSFEISWDFAEHPLVRLAPKNAESLIANAMHTWEAECSERFHQLKANEEELNRIFIDIYGLQDELAPDVDDGNVTVRLADVHRDIRSLISYIIGIIMGRYSLDSKGLAYAGGKWDSSKFITYQPDDDGIVPIYNIIGMTDGLTTKIIELIQRIYGISTYRQNIDYIADALGKNSTESSEETLNRYLNKEFFADTCKTYSVSGSGKRPIYWMFSSGENSGFKCLIYMHRYNEDTLARINAKYFLPQSTRLKVELDELLSRIESSEGKERIRLEKQREKLAASYREAIEYGQVLDHVANQYIPLDLDNGVKNNYSIFQNIEFINDNGTKIYKDLLEKI